MNSFVDEIIRTGQERRSRFPAHSYDVTIAIFVRLLFDLKQALIAETDPRMVMTLRRHITRQEKHLRTLMQIGAF